MSDLEKLPDWVVNELSSARINRNATLRVVKIMNKEAQEQRLKIRFKVKRKTGNIPYTNKKSSIYVIVQRRKR